MYHFRYTFNVCFCALLLVSCTNENDSSKKTTTQKDNLDQHQPKEYVEITHPIWTKNATIYEVNIRQYTPQGTFKAFAEHLPRLKKMGVDIIWLMPIHPIGVKNRKGSMGSYYSVKDYYGVNEEFGTMADFKQLVSTIHDMGMYVIIDWVANHTAWDNELVKQHPDWYLKNDENNFQSTPWRDYDDIIDFDYSQPALRQYMTDALAYWVKETNIDGYRCDIASFVPIEFWENARKELDKIKPVFMLAEAEDRDLHKRAFDMTYAWELWNHLHAITTQGKSVDGLTGGYIAEHVSIWPRNAYRMNFIDNHDKNSWEGNQYKNFGKGIEAAIVLTATLEGMPLVYSGQEAGLDRSLKFFDKDPIIWQDHPVGELYTKLFALKHQHKALWNGKYGGVMKRIKNDKMDKIVSFYREMESDTVITLVNLSDSKVNVILKNKSIQGVYTNIFEHRNDTISTQRPMEIKPWGFKVLSNQ
ncbi:alpha-amylase family glycosyl hydrolase [Gangjinia marincola]|uniref:Alpha-amylase family glycosyl hydrolase n=1 Tax=Gangjinia marincola TaxID=578463 RepID=A0ABP3XRX3_9FLAO